MAGYIPKLGHAVATTAFSTIQDNFYDPASLTLALHVEADKSQYIQSPSFLATFPFAFLPELRSDASGSKTTA